MQPKYQTFSLSAALIIFGGIQFGLWLTDKAPGVVGTTGALSTLFSAFLGFRAYRDAIELERIGRNAEAAGSEARQARSTADSALLGRRLFGDQIITIKSSAINSDFNHRKVSISYIPNVTDADIFARSLSDLFRDLGFSVVGPNAVNLHSYPQPKPDVLGTQIMLSGSSSAPEKSLTKSIKDTVPEISVGGVNAAWPFQEDIYAMNIIVGKNQGQLSL